MRCTNITRAAALLAAVGLAAIGGCRLPAPSGGAPPPAPAAAGVYTYHNDNARTGLYAGEGRLTLRSVNAAGFGKIGFLRVLGLVDAEPLFVPGVTAGGGRRDVVLVATEHDYLYAFDAMSFQQLWQVSLAGPGETPSDDRGCSQVTPEIGITATPVVDPSAGPNGTVFAVAMSRDAGGGYHQRLHALDVSTGAEQAGSPVEITASFAAPGSSAVVTFQPGQYKERAGLLLSGGVIYLAWASHCDITPYTGWVMGYDEASLRQVGVLDLTPNGSEGAVWMSAAGLAADDAGALYLLDGNGTFDTTLDARGFPARGDFGNSFLQVSPAPGLSVTAFFAPHNTVAESAADTDLGSGGAILLPDLQDAAGATIHLAVGAGKDGNLYVVNRDAMGGFNPAGDTGIYQELTAAFPQGVYAAPAWYQGSVYYGGDGDSLKAFAVTQGRLSTSPASRSAQVYGYPGAAPSVSSNGSRDGIVWAVENRGGTGILHAYDASDLSRELYNSTQAGSRDSFDDNKFVTPMIAAGRVYVGTPAGVAVFGLLAP